MSDKDDVIKATLEAMQPKERQCCICHEKFVGTRVVCSDLCLKYLPAFRAYNREHVWRRPIDYVSTARKTFLVEEIPAGVDSDPEDKGT